MNAIERQGAGDALAMLLRHARSDGTRSPEFWRAAESLAQVIGFISQSELARRIGRSRPTVAHLVEAGLLKTDDHGHVPALDAALVEVALEGRGAERNVVRRVVELVDWFAEIRDPAFRTGLEQYKSGEIAPFERPSVSAEERERRKQAFFAAQAEAANDDSADQTSRSNPRQSGQRRRRVRVKPLAG